MTRKPVPDNTGPELLDDSHPRPVPAMAEPTLLPAIEYLEARIHGLLYALACLRRKANLPQWPTCRVCGCWEYNACFTHDAGTCWWVKPDLCSHCAEQP